MEDQDGFTIVTRKSKHHFSLNSPRSLKLLSSKPFRSHSSATQVLSLIQIKREQLAAQTLLTVAYDYLSLFLSRFKNKAIKLLAIGIGDPLVSSASQHQLALYLHLISFLKSQQFNYKLLCIDPIFSNPEIQQLFQQLELPFSDLSEVKDQASLYSLGAEEVGVFLMPHCEKELYEFVIRHSVPKKIAILGNSFKKYKERAVDSDHCDGSVEFWATRCEERKMPYFGANQYAFGDMAFITF